MIRLLQHDVTPGERTEPHGWHTYGSMATLVDDWVETNARNSQPGAPSISAAPQIGAMVATGDVGAAPIFSLEPFDQQFAR